jgi:capsule biosynthesis phosphatase
MEKSTFVIDVDGTICIAEKFDNSSAFDYANARPLIPVIERIRVLYSQGHTIILHSSRGMKTYNGNLELIELHVRPVMEAWMAAHEVPYDHIVLGKPWGPNVYYVDDRSISPFEFTYQRGYENIININTLTL